MIVSGAADWAHWARFGLTAALALMLAACATIREWFRPPPIEIYVTVVPGTGLPGGPPTVLPCTALPASMALTATVQATGVMVEITGLQEGEFPTFRYLPAGSNRQSDGFEIIQGRPVGADGRAVDESWLRTTSTGNTAEVWEVRVLHARGVACTQVVLPPG